MTGPDGLRVEPERVTAHADAMTGIAGAVRAARPPDGGFSTDAYGVIGQVFAGQASAALAQGAVALTDLAADLERSAERLRASVQDYRLTDSRAALDLAAIEVPRAGDGDLG
ncbi:type VII secretion target [Pseudonocardia phyllosphaerae]|uniref:type VII secretion target n=1 Tax=Pseudonocardia phyllosphaerae TaxID=3390502 RepID=UPI00397D4ABE